MFLRALHALAPFFSASLLIGQIRLSGRVLDAEDPGSYRTSGVALKPIEAHTRSLEGDPAFG